ncbi:ankyrin repeat domain containing protein [Metarhizium rileyi]|uniref:Ankyrin repeat domain containing protein n=1 Tax=Metarhizium rileyi (strain RCEF 4871) TaxID=1649241 RepID=A0A166WSQ1_METRR|nr:ankyrin repeat domain containing protein [Metarhizium rileyi RCEF 4871]
MSYQRHEWSANGLGHTEDLRDGPFLPPKDTFSFDLKEALELPPSLPSSPSASTLSVPTLHRSFEGGPPPVVSRSPYLLQQQQQQQQKQQQQQQQQQLQLQLQERQQLQPSPVNVQRAASHRGFSMSSTNKAQTQCLQLCSEVAASCDRIAEKMSEYTSLVKHLPHGFSPLARDLLDTCQVLFYIEAGLGEAARHDQSLPLDMITVLEKKFRAAQIHFRALDQVVAKLLEHETRGAMGRMRRGFGKMFGDHSLERVSIALAKTREDLKIGALMFQWKLGSEKMESELGIGYIGLASALDGTEFRRRRADSVTSEDKGSAYRGAQRAPSQHRNVEDHHIPIASQSPLPVLPPIPKADLSSHYGHYSSTGESNGFTSSSEYGHLSPGTKRYTSSSAASSYDGHQSKRATGQDKLSTFEEAIEQSALDELVADVKNRDLDTSKKIHFDSEPFGMPRRKPRSNVDADRPNVKQVLVSAVRAKDHKLILQLLDRGVSPDTGIEAHALNEAILSHDAESIRLLLLYGVDVNATDKHGVSPLVAAAEKSYLDAAIALVKYGANPNISVGPEMDSPLSIAAVANNVSFTHLLLMYGGNPKQVMSNGNTILIASINKKTPKTLLEMLLNYGADANEKSREGKSALFEAITCGRADIVTMLIEHGANPNNPGPKHMLWPAIHQPACLQVLLANKADYKKAPGLMELATSVNSMEVIKILIKAGVDPNAKKDGVYTPLCTSIRDNRKEIFDLLLRSGADPNTPASEYPCFKCVTHHREHFLPALVAAGGNLNSPKGILETAVTSKNGPALKWLLDQGIDPNEKTPKGHTPLTSAIRDNHVGFVDTLLARGANPNIRGEDWPVCMAVRNPEVLNRILAVLAEPRAFRGVLERAVCANQLESVKLLLAAGVSVEDKNVGVFSPLTSSIRELHKEIFIFLINEGGADVNAPGEHLPIVKALRRCATEDPEVIDMLLEKGADPNKMYRGWNGIMQALENGDADILKKLAQKSGVDLNVKDEMGRTVTEIAISRRWEEGVDILLANAK